MTKLKQLTMFTQPLDAVIKLNERHQLVLISNMIDWENLIEISRKIRKTKIKKETGPQPHYRQLLGAVVLMAIRNITYREAEDLIAYYAPGRYLCDLMDCAWTPDHSTIFEFTNMLGPKGMEQINQYVLNLAYDEGVLKNNSLMSDTTAQEARIPYPTELGLMGNFLDIAKDALKNTGKKFSSVKGKIKKFYSKAKRLIRKSHLFAKGKEEKAIIGKQVFLLVQKVQKELKKAFSRGKAVRSKCCLKLKQLNQVMEDLLPQIEYFLTTGLVAHKKIIHLKMNELYSIVRGKAGKKVEFGIKWGINRIDGFVQGFVINNGAHKSDKKFCSDAIKVHEECFEEIPLIYGFDRGGYSETNIKKIQTMGVKYVGIAPKGKAAWKVSISMKKQITNERAQVEGVIGSIKSQKYGFNKPNAKSVPAMVNYGQRSILGFNLTKLIRETTKMSIQESSY